MNSKSDPIKDAKRTKLELRQLPLVFVGAVAGGAAGLMISLLVQASMFADTPAAWNLHIAVGGYGAITGMGFVLLMLSVRKPK